VLFVFILFQTRNARLKVIHNPGTIAIKCIIAIVGSTVSSQISWRVWEGAHMLREVIPLTVHCKNGRRTGQPTRREWRRRERMRGRTDSADRRKELHFHGQVVEASMRTSRHSTISATSPRRWREVVVAAAVVGAGAGAARAVASIVRKDQYALVSNEFDEKKNSFCFFAGAVLSLPSRPHLSRSLPVVSRLPAPHPLSHR
jgi:hypothetical protein